MKIKNNKVKIVLLACSILLIGSIFACGCSPKKHNNSSNISSDVSSKTPTEPPSEPQPLPSSKPTESETASSEIPSLQAVAIAVLDNDVLDDDLSSYENEKKGWGQGRRVNEENRPETCDLYQPKYEQYGAYFIMPKEDKNIYLTFDQGYENGYTSAILDVLKEKDCHVVFFVTMDYVKKNPDLIKRMIDEGHVIGNHSVHHYSMPTLTTAEQVEEIAGLHNYMVENYNYQMTLFRPPMGEYSTRCMYIAQKLGYKTVLWSFAYLDYDVKKQPENDVAFERVTSAAHNGAIYLLHAVSKTNTEILPSVLDKLNGDGYKFALLS